MTGKIITIPRTGTTFEFRGKIGIYNERIVGTPGTTGLYFAPDLNTKLVNSPEHRDYKEYPTVAEYIKALYDYGVLYSFYLEGPADLTGLQIPGANLTHARLEYVNLSGADLSGSILKGANLSSCKLSGTSFRNSDMTKDYNLKNPFFIKESKGEKPDFEGANLSGAWITDSSLEETNFRGANLCEAVLERVSIPNTNFTGADLRGASIQTSTLLRADFHRTDLRGAQLQAGGLQSACFEDAQLGGLQINTASTNEAFKLLNSSMLLEGQNPLSVQIDGKDVLRFFEKNAQALTPEQKKSLALYRESKRTEHMNLMFDKLTKLGLTAAS